MSSMPPVSSAATSFINESTLPRITPSLASMRWMVGSDRSDNSASLRWSMPSSARAARSCAAVIMFKTSIMMFLSSISIFIIRKIPFQAVRNDPVIPRTCAATRPRCRQATHGDDRPRTGDIATGILRGSSRSQPLLGDERSRRCGWRRRRRRDRKRNPRIPAGRPIRPGEFSVGLQIEIALHAADRKYVTELRANAQNLRLEAADAIARTAVAADVLVGVADQADLHLFGQ